MDKHTCPRCGGGIPNDEKRGEYPGAMSRIDNRTEICSACGNNEAMSQFVGETLSVKNWITPPEFHEDVEELRRVEVALVTKKVHCDFTCGKEAEFDGATKMGPWAYMCADCWEKHGVGRLGLGYGQKLVVPTS